MIETKEQLAQLTEDDWYQGVQLKVADAILGANEHRNIEAYPMIPEKVNDIMASIRASQTTAEIESGLWFNQEAAIYAPPDINAIEFNEDGIVTAFPLTGVEDTYPLRRPSGHHRAEAARKLKFAYHAVTVRIIDTDTRYRMMANENYDTYNAHPVAQMETVKQGKEILWGYANEYDTWGETNAAHSGAFANEKAWKNVKSQGVGKASLTHFLGKPWKDTAVAYLLRLVKNVERGVFTLKEVGKLPSVSTANAVGTLLTTLHDKKAWPDAFKDRIAAGCMKVICDPNNVATVKVISDAKDFMLNQNFNPVGYLKNKSMVVFDLHGELVKYIKAQLKEDESWDIATMVDTGFAGYEKEISAAIEEINSGTAAPVTTAEGEADAAEAEAASAIEGVELPEMPDADVLADFSTEVPDTAEAGDVSVTATIKSFIETSYELEMLAGRLMDMDIDYENEGNAPLTKAVMAAMTVLHKLGTEKMGLKG